MHRPAHLLIVDPQNDFCDIPAAQRPPGQAPALPVPGADADMRRLAGLVRDVGADFERITITLDSHHRLDIAHPTFWASATGDPVAPFTTITAAQVRRGDYVPRDAAARQRALAYLEALEARGRYTLMVWPVHCEIGTWGHAVHAELAAACADWERQQGRTVRLVRKGQNPWTEHYSAILAEVPDPGDPATEMNRSLLDELDRAERLVIAGEASSHCVRATTEDIVAHLPGGHPERLALLTDCMSPVSGFEAQHAAFLQDMQARGVALARTEVLRAAAA